MKSNFKGIKNKVKTRETRISNGKESVSSNGGLENWTAIHN